eukprot:TRINITY_DN10516_c0_g1_i1.p1 TRINITY_DN10516_c0_g1~~TRINITY_DN10516_c0_g1_i1.p1  ORF type:complete len:1311 (+),score=226.61 TRINITY_DN10516_c0_g1_i1:86-4018(+)
MTDGVSYQTEDILTLLKGAPQSLIPKARELAQYLLSHFKDVRLEHVDERNQTQSIIILHENYDMTALKELQDILSREGFSTKFDAHLPSKEKILFIDLLEKSLANSSDSSTSTPLLPTGTTKSSLSRSITSGPEGFPDAFSSRAKQERIQRILDMIMVEKDEHDSASGGTKPLDTLGCSSEMMDRIRSIVKEICFTHDDVELDKITFRWNKIGDTAISHDIAKYFGLEFGLFFEWQRLYNTKMVILLTLSILSFIDWIFPRFSMGRAFFPWCYAIWAIWMGESWSRHRKAILSNWDQQYTEEALQEADSQHTTSETSTDNHSMMSGLRAGFVANLILATLGCVAVMIPWSIAFNLLLGQSMSIWMIILMGLHAFLSRPLGIKIVAWTKIIDDFDFATKEHTNRSHLLKILILELSYRCAPMLMTAVLSKDVYFLKWHLSIYFIVTEAMKLKEELSIEDSSEKSPEDLGSKNKPPETSQRGQSRDSGPAGNEKLIKQLHERDPSSEDYLLYKDSMIQMAVISCFASALPLITMPIIFINLLHMNEFLYKIVHKCKRPTPSPPFYPGYSEKLFTTISYMAAFINPVIFYVVWRSDAGDGSNWKSEHIILFALLGEHLLLAFKFSVAYLWDFLPSFSTDGDDAVVDLQLHTSGLDHLPVQSKEKPSNLSPIEDTIQILQQIILRRSILVGMILSVFSSYFQMYWFVPILLYAITRERQSRNRERAVRKAIIRLQSLIYQDPSKMPQSETLEWINALLTSLWKTHGAMVTDILKTSLNETLSSRKPVILSTLELRECEFKTMQTLILDASIVEPSRDRSLCIILGIDISMGSDIVLAAGIGVAATLKLTKISLKGRMKLEMALIDEAPFVDTITIQLLSEPELNYGIVPLNAKDIMDINFISDAIQNLIKDQIKANLVDKPINIAMRPNPDSESRHSLKIKIIKAENIAGSSLYCKVRTPGRAFKTKAIKGGPEIVWDEEIVFDVSVSDGRIKDDVKICLYDAVIAGRTSLGVVQLPLHKLAPHQQTDAILDVEDTRMGTLTVHLCWEPNAEDLQFSCLEIDFKSFNKVTPVIPKSVSFHFQMNNHEIIKPSPRLTRDNSFDWLEKLHCEQVQQRMRIVLTEDDSGSTIDAVDVQLPDLKQNEKKIMEISFTEHIQGTLHMEVKPLRYSDQPLTPLCGMLSIHVAGFENLHRVNEVTAGHAPRITSKMNPFKKMEKRTLCWIFAGKKEAMFPEDEFSGKDVSLEILDARHQYVRIFLGKSKSDPLGSPYSLKIPISEISMATVIKRKLEFTRSDKHREDDPPKIEFEAIFARRG